MAMNEDLGKVDAVAFDCDGVLVDARRSYDKAIRVVVETMVRELTGTKLSLVEAAPELIATVRRTGGFNSDWDTTYALTVFAFAALKGGDKSGTPLERLEALTARFGAAPRKGGVRDANAFLDDEFPSLADSLKKADDYLGYPGTPPKSRMATLFDQLYFGASLYQESHGFAGNGPRRGFIELERVLLKRQALKSLEKIVGRGRLAIITGRPSLGTAHTLGKAIMGSFDRDASIFIGDADIKPEMRAEYDRFRKPSPEALVRASEKFSSKMLLYVGDSAEDLMMVADARDKGRLQTCLFAGVYGMSPEPEEQIAFFDRNGADVIAKSVNEIPARLLEAREDG
jgi:phosphoglycolate phosphatase-like HAD superfamily hydrolase